MGAPSSSASAMKITSRDNGTPFSARRSAAMANTASPPLKSIAPRPYTWPSLITPANGSSDHFSRSTPTTSACAASNSGRLLPSPLSRAMKCTFPESGVGMISTEKPAALNRTASKSASACVLPGGLLVFTRMSSLSSAAVGSTVAAGCATGCAYTLGVESANPSVHITRAVEDHLEGGMCAKLPCVVARATHRYGPLARGAPVFPRPVGAALRPSASTSALPLHRDSHVRVACLAHCSHARA